MRLRTFLVSMLAVLIMAGSCWSFADVVPSAIQNIGWAGYRYDQGSLFSYGYGRQAIGRIWAFTGMNVGQYAGWDIIEVAALFKVNENFWLGPLAGGNVNWIETPPEDDPVAYLNGTAGGMFAWQFLPTQTVMDKSLRLGLWGYCKLNWNPDRSDRWVAGGGVYIGF